MTSFDKIVIKLVEIDDSTLVLLGHVISHSCLAALTRSNHEDVEFVLILYWRWELYFQRILK